MSDFHFLRPYLLLLLIPCALLLWLLLHSKQATNIWQKICAQELMPYVLVGKTQRFYTAAVLLFATFALLVTALAGPAWQTLSQPLLKTQSGLVIALDLSPTMDAEDIKPSRLKRALYKINDILSLRLEGQTALLVYSKESFVVTPLTDDNETIKALLPALETQIMPAAGHGAGHGASKAIAKSAELLAQAGLSEGSVLLVAAELTPEERDKAIASANEKGIRVFVLGVGTNESTPITKAQGGFVTDDKGALVITTLAKDNLAHLATATQGRYATISLDDSDINGLSSHFITAHDRTAEESAQHNAWHDQGYLLAAIALPFVALLFRRGIFLSLFLLTPHTLQALSWDNLWYTPDQQAARLFQQEQYQQAQEKFQNPDWQGATQYKMGDYEAAAKLFEQNPSTESLYNFGTAKAKQGDFKAAIEAYQKVLAAQPDHEDALYNKKLIEEMQQQQNNNESGEKQENQQQNQDQTEQQGSQENSEQQDQQPDKQGQNDEQQQEHTGEDSQQSDSQQPQQSDKQQPRDANEQQGQQSKDQKENKENAAQQNQPDLTEEAKAQYRDQITEQLDQQQAEEPSSEPVVQNEEQTAAEQQRDIDERWLQRIPDDPGGLLRRKFHYQYKQNHGNQR